MATYYNPAELTWDGLKDAVVKERYKQETANGWVHMIPPLCGTHEPPTQALGEGVEPNIIFTYLFVNGSSTILNPINYGRNELKLNVNPSRSHAVCLVRFKAKMQMYAGADAETDIYTILSKSQSDSKLWSDAYCVQGAHREVSPSDANNSITEIKWADGSVTSSVSTTGAMRYHNVSGVSHWSQPVSYGAKGQYIDTNIENFISTTKATDESAIEWRRLQAHSTIASSNDAHYCLPHPQTGSSYIDVNIFPYWASTTPSTTNGYIYLMSLEKLPEDVPLFDLNDGAEKIIAYLDNGDDSGRIDPFTPPYPKKEVIEDYATNYRVFVTPYEENKERTKFSVIAYNGDLINYFDDLVEDYHMTVKEYTGLDDMRTIGTTPMEMYPTLGFNTLIPQLPKTYNLALNFHNDDNTEHSETFYVGFEYRADSAIHCVIKSVLYGLRGCTRTAIVDGHRYTAPTGEWVEILYRTPRIEDLDDSYPNPEDSEDDRTGVDSDFVVGNGLNTFPITGAQFGQINKKLWSTDWTQVFKSSSIDPIRCVIGCKGIPFTATPAAMEHIIIANLDTGVDANTCNPVKSFDIGTVVMPSFRGDFSDITMTRVHLYLPFIGWVDLPSSEVISRVAHADVGISANTKRLRFKYIVDFVDGSCRCIVSVNGSERWFFDGHCDVDIPVTSDNHTQAVGNAIRSGVGAVLSVASAVGGAIAENPMMIATGVTGAITNGANVIPTYNYSASSSPSGYINASMNNHIMIVIEHPNLVMASNFAHKNGRPCGLTLSLGSLRGYTRCINVDTSGINGTETELSMIKSMLESGVYL